MANTFNKRELEKKKKRKKKEKELRKQQRKAGGVSSFEDMIAYVDENGMLCDTPPDPQNRQEVAAETIAVSTPRREEETTEPLQGRIEYFNESKGFGFIKQKDGVDKIFFHVSNAEANLSEGSLVTFELEKSDRGMAAVKVEALK